MEAYFPRKAMAFFAGNEFSSSFQRGALVAWRKIGMEVAEGMKKILFLILILCLLTGCFGSSGVLPLGQGTYSLTVETPYIVGAHGTKKKAFDEAQSYCAEKGKEMNVLQYRGSSPAHNVFDMTFECR